MGSCGLVFYLKMWRKKTKSMIFTSVISLLLGKLFLKFPLKIFKKFRLFYIFNVWFLPKFIFELTWNIILGLMVKGDGGMILDGVEYVGIIN